MGLQPLDCLLLRALDVKLDIVRARLAQHLVAGDSGDLDRPSRACPQCCATVSCRRKAQRFAPVPCRRVYRQYACSHLFLRIRCEFFHGSLVRLDCKNPLRACTCVQQFPRRVAGIGAQVEDRSQRPRLDHLLQRLRPVVCRFKEVLCPSAEFIGDRQVEDTLRLPVCQQRPCPAQFLPVLPDKGGIEQSIPDCRDVRDVKFGCLHDCPDVCEHFRARRCEGEQDDQVLRAEAVKHVAPAFHTHTLKQLSLPESVACEDGLDRDLLFPEDGKNFIRSVSGPPQNDLFFCPAQMLPEQTVGVREQVFPNQAHQL